jgi:tetratricopeptide (TPR) repeat protein
LSAADAPVARDAVYFSNRSAAYANSANFDAALEDALRVIKLKPAWVKGHMRAAAAYMGLELYSEAKEAYEKAVKLEPDDQVGTRRGGSYWAHG